MFDKGDTKAMGRWSEGVFRERLRGDETFWFVAIAAAAGVVPDVCVQLDAAAPPARLAELTPQVASQWLERWEPTAAERASGYTDRLYPGARSAVPSPGEVLFVGDASVVSFDVGRERVRWLTLGARTWWRAWATRAVAVAAPNATGGPRLGPASCATLHALPLGRAELVEVFGAADWEGWTRGQDNDAAANLLILF